MTSNLISSKVCIARLYDQYNIDFSGVIPRIPNWIYQALNKLDAIQSLIDVKEDATVSNYKCEVPARMKELVAVEYEGFRLPNIEEINSKYEDNIGILQHLREKYERNGNYIITTFEEGDIVFYYKAYPLEFDDTYNVYFPLIEENEDLLEAIDSYILKTLLQRGHIIPALSLKENNEFTNPALRFETLKRVVRNSLLHITSDLRFELHKEITTFLTRNNYHDSIEFNPYKNE